MALSLQHVSGEWSLSSAQHACVRPADPAMTVTVTVTIYTHGLAEAAALATKHSRSSTRARVTVPLPSRVAQRAQLRACGDWPNASMHGRMHACRTKDGYAPILKTGAIDFAGSGVVHMVSGAACRTCCVLNDSTIRQAGRWLVVKD